MADTLGPAGQEAVEFLSIGGPPAGRGVEASVVSLLVGSTSVSKGIAFRPLEGSRTATTVLLYKVSARMSSCVPKGRVETRVEYAIRSECGKRTVVRFFLESVDVDES